MRWRPPEWIDFDRWTQRFDRYGIDPTNRIADGWLYRVVDDAPYRARREGEELVVESDGPLGPAIDDIAWRTGAMLDSAPLMALAADDDKVAWLVQRYPGLRPALTADPFESLITSVTAQQVNLRWALTTRRRLIERYGVAHRLGPVTVYSFPSAAALAGADVAEVRAMQFTRNKAEYIVGIAQAAASGWLEGLGALSNEAAINHLVERRGVGRWTAEWFLARCLGRPDVIAAGDLGVRKAVSFSYRASDHILSEDVVRDIAAPWADATNLTVHLLLETLH